MGVETACPICRFANIPTDGVRCPQCDADLSCFKVLDSLPDQWPAENSPSGRSRWPFLWLGLFICHLAALFFFQYHLYERLEARIAALQDRLASTADHDRNRPAPVAGPEVPTEEARTKSGADAVPGKSLNSRPPSPRRAEGQAGEQRSDRFWIYQADENDTLWGIAEKYYGHGRYYPVILEHNPGVGIYEIGRWTTLRMVNDRQAVKKLLGEITERKGPRLFWYYTVAGGDTWNSIVRRFYKTEDQIPQVTDLNQGLEIEPGARVKIALE